MLHCGPQKLRTVLLPKNSKTLRPEFIHILLCGTKLATVESRDVVSAAGPFRGLCLLGYLPTLEQAGIVYARPRVRRMSQAAWGRRVRLHTRGLRRRDRVRQSRHRRVRNMKV